MPLQLRHTYEYDVPKNLDACYCEIIFYCQEKQQTVERKRENYRQRLQEAVEEARLMEQSKRNTARAKQEMTEIVAYERQYGKVGASIKGT